MTKKLTLLFALVAMAVGVRAQSKFHVRAEQSENSPYYVIAYTNDNWKTKRFIRDGSLGEYYKSLFDTVQEAAEEAKKYKTFEICEAHNRSEYRKRKLASKPIDVY